MKAKTTLLSKIPIPLSTAGGLPGRGVKEPALAQKRELEDSVHGGKLMVGHSLDVIKAYNTCGRYTVMQIMRKLGMPRCIACSWISNLDVMVRFPHINGAVTSGISSTTGVLRVVP